MQEIKIDVTSAIRIGITSFLMANLDGNGDWEPYGVIEAITGATRDLPPTAELRPDVREALDAEYVNFLFNELHRTLVKNGDKEFANAMDAMHHDYADAHGDESILKMPRRKTLQSLKIQAKIDEDRILTAFATSMHEYVVTSPNGGVVIEFATAGVNGKSAHDTAKANVSDMSEQVPEELTLWSKDDEQILCRAQNGMARP